VTLIEPKSSPTLGRLFRGSEGAASLGAASVNRVTAHPPYATHLQLAIGLLSLRIGCADYKR